MAESEKRKEFRKFRTKLLKENEIEHLICARCGEWRVSIHLHHIIEVVHGGKNEASNLIPLCYKCHNEWDYWNDGEFNFGTFLLTPRLQDIRKIYFGRIAISRRSLEMCRALWECCRSQDWAAQFHDGVDDDQYRYEFRRQNEVFNQYPYSDVNKMFELYGEISPPVVLENLPEETYFNTVGSKISWLN